jgi:hypothetical protein
MKHQIIHGRFYLLTFCVLISIIMSNITFGSAEDCIDPNQFYPNEEQFCGQYMYWNASSISTPITTISFNQNIQIRVAFDLYLFLDDKTPQTYAQIEIVPFGFENYDTSMDLEFDDSLSNSPVYQNAIVSFFVFECTPKKNGNVLQNYSYIIGADQNLFQGGNQEIP